MDLQTDVSSVEGNAVEGNRDPGEIIAAWRLGVQTIVDGYSSQLVQASRDS